MWFMRVCGEVPRPKDRLLGRVGLYKKPDEKLTPFDSDGPGQSRIDPVIDEQTS